MNTQLADATNQAWYEYVSVNWDQWTKRNNNTSIVIHTGGVQEIFRKKAYVPALMLFILTFFASMFIGGDALFFSIPILFFAIPYTIATIAWNSTTKDTVTICGDGKFRMRKGHSIPDWYDPVTNLATILSHNPDLTVQDIIDRIEYQVSVKEREINQANKRLIKAQATLKKASPEALKQQIKLLEDAKSRAQDELSAIQANKAQADKELAAAGLKDYR